MMEKLFILSPSVNIKGGKSCFRRKANQKQDCRLTDSIPPWVGGTQRSWKTEEERGFEVNSALEQ